LLVEERGITILPGAPKCLYPTLVMPVSVLAKRTTLGIRAYKHTVFSYGTILMGISTRRELAPLFETWLGGDEPFLFARSLVVEKSSQANAGNILFPCVENAHSRRE